ncbi:MAG: DEAD/DEAH box helicase family protein [Gammaproteobacteria bacterium]|nr:DEAD/DEAH box helicase family protein [Gammaproteobacteria bacterium]
MKKLSRDAIRINVGSQNFALAEKLCQHGNVVFNVSPDERVNTVKLHSMVMASNGKRLYVQQIHIVWDDDGCVDIDSKCSCTTAFNCEHVAAVCMNYAGHDVADSPPDAQCLTWIEQLSDAGASGESHASPTENAGSTRNELLVYLLKPCKQPGKLEVELRIARPLKKGGLGKGREINLERLTAYYTAACIQTIDQEIGRLLEANNTHHWRDISVYGDMGLLALTKMVKTGRCYWLNSKSTPLQLGSERTLTLQWQADDHDDATLQLQIEPAALPLLTEPAYYLDPDTACIGPLHELPYSSEQLEQLLNAPTVPKKLVDEFSQRLARKIPSAILQPPKPVDVEEISAQTPTPCLLLCGRDAPNHRYHVIQLRFAYGEHEICYFPEEENRHFTRGDSIVSLWRDVQAEQAATEQLESLGFSGRIDLNEEDLVFLSLTEHGRMASAARWQNFIYQSVPELEQQGWRIEYDASFEMTFHEADQWHAQIDEGDESDSSNDWFDLRFDVEINDQPVALLPLISQVLENYDPEHLPEILTLHLGGSQYLNIASAQLKPIIDTLYELYDSDSLQDDGSLRMSRFDAGRLTELDEQGTNNLHWRGGEALRKLGQKLKDFRGISTVEPAQGLNVTLREYQQQGLNWLQFLREYGFAGILADDMGLGKTVQTLAHLLLEKEQGRMTKPCLIVAPTSLMSNWRRETEQFAPALKVLILQGPDRHQHFEKITEHDLILSTYPLLVRDEEQLLAHDYHALVLDEAQVIKNPKAKAAKVIRKIKTGQRLCLTGTPMENHLGELWALFDFLMPGFLGDARQFTTLFRTPIEKQGNDERRQRLVQRIAPFMLRRTKAEVVKELPDKTEILRTVTLDKKQAALYESIRISMEKKVRDAIASKGLARSHITILDALLKLRQVCCDPRLLSLKQARAVKESAKLELLMQLLPEMVEEGRRILLFSQFTTMLGHIETELKRHKISYSKLTGQTRKRDAVIEKFKSGEAAVFLISLKAGGVGLNLTEADTVIHYDPWWNPAAENQATDRAHRIGQDKAVFVYKLVTENSVEEKIVAMQERKQALAQGVYNKNRQGEESKLSASDLQQLFAPL